MLQIADIEQFAYDYRSQHRSEGRRTHHGNVFDYKIALFRELANRGFGVHSVVGVKYVFFTSPLKKPDQFSLERIRYAGTESNCPPAIVRRMENKRPIWLQNAIDLTKNGFW